MRNFDVVDTNYRTPRGFTSESRAIKKLEQAIKEEIDARVYSGSTKGLHPKGQREILIS